MSPPTAQAARPDAFVGTVLAGRYQILRVLGTGGMGSVYEGKHTTTGKRVAIKVLAPHLSKDLKLVARFRREAMAASRIEHENCVQVDDFGEDGAGTFYIAMELIDGRGLGDELRAGGPMPPARVARIGVQLLKGLDAAHVGGVLHRDLKPQNLMLSQKPGRPDMVKVVDFGIAKITTNEPGDQVALTVPGTIFGTPEYMSPEQARGETLDARSDLYSASVVLWHMLLGRSPFRGTSVRDTLLKVFAEEAPSPTAERPGLVLPPGFEEVLRKGLAKNKDQRWPDAASYAAALARFVEGPVELPALAAPGLPRDGSPPPPTLDKVTTGAGPRDTIPLPASPLPVASASRAAHPSATTPPAKPMHPGPPVVSAPIIPAGAPKAAKVLTVDAVKGGQKAAAVPASVSAPRPVRRQRISPAALVVIIGGLLLLIGFVVVATLVVSGNLKIKAPQSPPGPVVGAPPQPSPPPPSDPSKLQAALGGTMPLDPLARDAALGRAERAIAEGRRQDARVAFEEAVAADPTAPAALIGLGTLSMQQRDWGVARDCFEQLISLDKTYRKQFGPMYARAKRFADEAAGQQ